MNVHDIIQQLLPGTAGGIGILWALVRFIPKAWYRKIVFSITVAIIKAVRKGTGEGMRATVHEAFKGVPDAFAEMEKEETKKEVK